MKKTLLLAAIILATLPVSAQHIEEADTAQTASTLTLGEDVSADKAVADTLPEGFRRLDIDEVMAAVAASEEGYSGDWTQLSMQGKLSMEGLPMRPTVKIYMDRDSSIIMSARAPFFGEVARVEICADSIAVINKHTKKYLSIGIQRLSRSNPSLIRDFQDILLGNVAYPGHGRLTSDLALASQWTVTPDDEVFVYPGADLQFGGVEYGYLLDMEDFNLLSFMLMLHASDAILNMRYLFGEEGWTLGIEAEMNKRLIRCELELSYPDFDPVPLQMTNAGARYSRTDFKGILKF